MNQEELQCIFPYHIHNWLPTWVHPLYQVWHQIGIQQHLNQKEGWMESSVSHTRRTIQAKSNVFQTNQLPYHILDDDKYHLPQRGSKRIDVSLHGQHCHPHQTQTWRNHTTTYWMTQKTHPPCTGQAWKGRLTVYYISNQKNMPLNKTKLTT